ncbi:MAG: sulfurtransferase [Hyphomicrobiales bacterium]|nr:MAG: sulfurtransferase [Hyphomicrobiales bacterium]
MRLLKNFGTLLGAALVAVSIGGMAQAADPLVSVDWVKANTGADGVVFVDLRPATDYLRGHIPGAVNTNYGKDGWREAQGPVPGQLPKDTAKLAGVIGNLGIGNSSHVVLVPPGKNSTDMGIGTRLYWTFKVLGHEEVSILDGGMAAYLAEQKDKKPVNPLEKGAAKPEAQTFAVNLNKDMVISIDDVKAAGENGIQLVDARTADQYLGVNRHGKSKASGTIDGARNLPQSWMTENGGGKFRSTDTLKKLYAAAGVDTGAPQITFCNTGHWASMDWFVSSELLGNKQTKMYDGSMTEWTNAGQPTTAQITLQ